MRHRLGPVPVGLVILFSAAAFAHEGASGVVESVVPGGAAEAAGVKAGDRIVTIAGQPLSTRDDLGKIVAAHKPGETVPVVVERDGARSTLSLTFGARPDGGASIGISVRLAEPAEPAGQGAGPGDGKATAECLAWIDGKYRVEEALRDLGLDRAEDWSALRACVERDTRRMSAENAVRYCDNVFKVHCSAGDLLAEVGESWIERCATALGQTLGTDVKSHQAWRTCASPRLFDGYVLEGKLPTTDDCRATFVDACGAKLEPAPRKTP
jgi:hypothetical protein